MTQNVSLKYTAVKNFNFSIETWRTAAILKIEKKTAIYCDDAQRVSQACHTSAILDR